MHISKKYIIITLCILLAVSLVANVFVYRYFQSKYEPKFTLLSPSIAWMELGDFRSVQKQYSIQYQELRQQLFQVVNGPDVKGHYAVYFEDLNTGSWIGLDEKEQIVPASLLKVPILVATLKKIENGDMNLDDKITLTADDLDTKSGTLGTKGVGYQVTVKELLTYLIKESDNTAVLALNHHLLKPEEIVEAKLAMGLPMGSPETYDAIGAKHYSNILRSLYYSAYLRRTSSELALSIMSETDYNSQLPAGLPKDIPISHKIGFYYQTDGLAGYHDCGIVYYPSKHYILCVMSADTTKEEADYIISKISKITYEYIDNKFGEE